MVLLRFVEVMLPVFQISCDSVLGFVHPRQNHWLEVLIICNLSNEIFVMFMQDSGVARLGYISYYWTSGMAQ
jgi:hypothetical protein